MGRKKVYKKARKSAYDVLLAIVVLIVFLMVLSPLFIVIATSINTQRIVFPPEGFTLQWFAKLFTHEEFINAAKNSILVALLSAAGSTVMGLMVCMAYRYYKLPGKTLIFSVFNSPLLVPAVIIGLALYQVVMLSLGAKTFATLLIGHMVITMPFPIRIIESMLETVDISKEEAAMSVGASRIKTFFRITLPLIKPGVVGGALYAAIISWNNFPISMFLSTLDSITLPIRIFNYLEYQYEPLIAAMGAVVVGFSFIFIILIDHYIGLNRIYGKG